MRKEKNVLTRTGLLLCALTILSVVDVYSQNTSYNANTIPIGGSSSVGIGFQALSVNTGTSNTFQH
jgi:hypothetical protein